MITYLRITESALRRDSVTMNTKASRPPPKRAQWYYWHKYNLYNVCNAAFTSAYSQKAVSPKRDAHKNQSQD